MKNTLKSFRENQGPVISIRCPHCGHFGTFHNAGIGIFEQQTQLWFGQSWCPNKKCEGHVFVISDLQGNIQRTYPGDTIPFDKNGIPDNVLNAFGLTPYSLDSFN